MDKPFVVNLASKSGLSYLQVNVQFKLKTSDLRQKFHVQLPAIENTMVMLLRVQTAENIRSVKGKQALR
ncbi:MAG: flagellar basal body-associated FliL family protein [Gammaproteobacteria bacterium]|jgi:flagellar basal body-associated protein FliL